MAGTKYQGKAALTLVRITDGTQRYVYRGDPVPQDAQDVQRLLEREFIEEADDEAAGVAHGAEQSANEANEADESASTDGDETTLASARRTRR